MKADGPLAFDIRRVFGKSRAEQVGMPTSDLQAFLSADPRVGFGVCLRLSLASEYFGHAEPYGNNAS